MPLPRSDFPTPSKTLLEFERIQQARGTNNTPAQRIVNRTIQTPLVELGSPHTHNNNNNNNHNSTANTRRKQNSNTQNRVAQEASLRRLIAATSRNEENHNENRGIDHENISLKPRGDGQDSKKDTARTAINETIPKNTSEIQLLCGEVNTAGSTNSQPQDSTSQPNAYHEMQNENLRKCLMKLHAAITEPYPGNPLAHATPATVVRDYHEKNKGAPTIKVPELNNTEVPTVVTQQVATAPEAANGTAAPKASTSAIYERRIFLDISQDEDRSRYQKELERLGGIVLLLFDPERLALVVSEYCVSPSTSHADETDERVYVPAVFSKPRAFAQSCTESKIKVCGVSKLQHWLENQNKIATIAKDSTRVRGIPFKHPYTFIYTGLHNKAIIKEYTPPLKVPQTYIDTAEVGHGVFYDPGVKSEKKKSKKKAIEAVEAGPAEDPQRETQTENDKSRLKESRTETKVECAPKLANEKTEKTEKKAAKDEAPYKLPGILTREGYCENCEKQFTNLAEHRETPEHQGYARSFKHYADVDRLVELTRRKPRQFFEDAVVRRGGKRSLSISCES